MNWFRTFVAAVNDIQSQTWAAYLVFVGACMFVWCSELRIDTNAASGIIGAGLGMFQAAAKHTNIATGANSIIKDEHTNPNG